MCFDGDEWCVVLDSIECLVLLLRLVVAAVLVVSFVELRIIRIRCFFLSPIQLCLGEDGILVTVFAVAFALSHYFYYDLVVRGSPGMPYLDFVYCGRPVRGIALVFSPGLHLVEDCLLALCFGLVGAVPLVLRDSKLLRVSV